MYAAVHNFEIGDDAPEGIENGVENQGLKRSVRVALRCRYPLHDGIQHFFDTRSRLCRNFQHFLRLAAYHIHNLVCHYVYHSRVHIDFVEHRYDFKSVFHSKIEIGYGLGLYALGRVHNQKGSFAGGNGAGDLVGEVHVARSVNEVEGIIVPAVLVLHLHRMALDCDTLLLLQIHRVQHLILHIPGIQGVGDFEHPVGKSAFAVVDVCDNAEIPYIVHILLCINAYCRQSLSVQPAKIITNSLF